LRKGAVGVVDERRRRLSAIPGDLVSCVDSTGDA
jgi:hypothetical protein